VLCLAPLARYVPKPALAALLLLTATRLIDLKRVAYTIRASRMDAGTLGVTALAALAFGLDQAILIGVALSILLFVPRAAKLKATELVVDENDVVREKLPADPTNAGFLLYDLEGELFFGAAPELARTFAAIERRAHEEDLHDVLLRLKRVRNPDVVSLEHFEHFLKTAEASGLTVWLTGLQPDLLEAFERLNFHAWLSDDHVFPQGPDEDSATLTAIRLIRSGMPIRRSDKLSYLVQ
jgi:SulP family sulfate permease